jgi:hypothetical protein
VDDLTGRRFRTYNVIEARGKNKYGALLWFCRCDCGFEAIHQAGNLRRGGSSCPRCRKKSVASQAINDLWHNYRVNAVNRGHVFDLDRVTFAELLAKNCRYCNAPPAQQLFRYGAAFVYNGIDRIDNTGGYVEGNVDACCGDCNRGKLTRSEPEFLAWVARIYQYRIAP